MAISSSSISSLYTASNSLDIQVRKKNTGSESSNSDVCMVYRWKRLTKHVRNVLETFEHPVDSGGYVGLPKGERSHGALCAFIG